jgi:hypothetical protein
VRASLTVVNPHETGSAARCGLTEVDAFGRDKGHAPRRGPGRRSRVPQVGPAQPGLHTQSPSAEQPTPGAPILNSGTRTGQEQV